MKGKPLTSASEFFGCGLTEVCCRNLKAPKSNFNCTEKQDQILPMDGELLNLITLGNKQAFEVLYRKYWKVLFLQVKHIICDEHSAEDIVQDVFSSLWLRVNNITEIQNIGGYLFVSAKRKVLNKIRSERQKNSYIQHTKYSTEHSCYDTLNYLNERELNTLIVNEIAALPPRMRQVFEMSRMGYLSHGEIGNLLGTSTETVNKQIKKSLKILRKKIALSGSIS